MSDFLFAVMQYLLPQHAISRLIGTLAESEISWIKRPLIKWFIQKYQVNMDEALESDLNKYSSFNQFFTRALKPGAREIDQTDGVFVSPADGVISQFGAINDGSLIQAKGKNFTVQQLLACDAEFASVFSKGQFATIYLSPSDYHRLHMPCDATLSQMTFVPGKLFSVNEATANHVDGLFARNERVVAIFETPKGKVAMVLVGAMIVASIETVWAGEVAPVRQRVQHINYSNNQQFQFNKGDEMGRFKLGSTVVMLTENPDISWNDVIKAGDSVRMGQKIAQFSN